jgi:hypothetical protein
MPKNDEFRNFEIADSEFESRTRAMVETTGLTRGDQVSHITDDEQVSWPAISENCRIDAGIATTDDKGQGRLPTLGKTLIEGAVSDKVVVAKAMIAGYEF